MHAHAIHTTGAGRCGGGHAADLRAIWHEMTGGREGGPGHGRHRRHGGPGPGGFGGMGFAGFGPGGGPRGRGRKARRGDIRTAALLLLAEEPRNGYQIMQEVEQRSDGVWRPSPGSVYPALQQLEDEGLIRSEQGDGRKLFALSDDGRAYLDKRDPDAQAPWEQMSDEVSDQAFEAKRLLPEIHIAFMQVMRSGSEAQLAQAAKVLSAARRDLYRILADEDQETATGAPDQDA